MTETATTTIDTESHWQWVRDLIGEATAGVETDDEIDGWLRTSTGYAIPAGPAADTEVAETGTCQSCGRTLTSAASIARGRGPRCAAKIRRAARLQGRRERPQVLPPTVRRHPRCGMKGPIMKFRTHDDHGELVDCDSSCCYERYTAMHRGNPPLTFDEWREVDI